MRVGDPAHTGSAKDQRGGAAPDDREPRRGTVAQCLGQLSVFVVFGEPEPDEVALADDFAEELAVAAWAIAPPPPTSTPETIKTASPLLMCCRISFTSSRCSVGTHSSRGNCGSGTRGL